MYIVDSGRTALEECKETFGWIVELSKVQVSTLSFKYSVLIEEILLYVISENIRL